VEVKQGGEPRTTTMLFSDIRGFTSRSETMPAEDIVAMLNDYFERMVEIVFRYEGTLDKFVGDEIMALFGAPVSPPRRRRARGACALAMLDELRALQHRARCQGLPSFEIGIGINTGEVVAGYIGSSKAMQYTVIGAPGEPRRAPVLAAKGMQILLSETPGGSCATTSRCASSSPSSPRASPSPCGSSRSIITFVDTSGAYPGIGAEERGQSEAIGQSLLSMAELGVPVITVVIGEGGSGGALALAVANKVLVLEFATYSVISPEGCASILWKDGSQASRAASELKITAPDLLRLGVVDGVIEEPAGGAHRDHDLVARSVGDSIAAALDELSELTPGQLREQRYRRFRALGEYSENS
jgi:hypothetical protein